MKQRVNSPPIGVSRILLPLSSWRGGGEEAAPSLLGLLFIHISINLKFVIRIILYNTKIIDFL